MKQKNKTNNLPQNASDFIDQVVKKIRFNKTARAEVRTELTAHFEDALNDCITDQQSQNAAEEIIHGFGDKKMLSKLIKRGKSRCRPLWQKVLIRTAIVFGCLIAFLILRVVTLTVQKPTISIDYLQYMNDRVRAGMAESQNARYDYEKAIELMPVDEPNLIKDYLTDFPEKFTPEEEVAIFDFIQANQPALEQMRKGIQKEAFWAEYKLKDDVQITGAASFPSQLLSVVLSNLSECKELAKRLQLSSNWHLCNGEADAALADAVGIYKYGNQMVSKGLLIEQLVGIAINAMGTMQINKVLENGDVSSDKLIELQNAIGKTANPQDILIDPTAEKVCVYDMVQRGFTDDGTGSGRVLITGIPFVCNSPGQSIKDFVFFSFPERRAIVNGIENAYVSINSRIEKTPATLKAENYDYKKFLKEGTDIRFLQVILPAFDKVAEKSWQLIADRRALIATIAIMRYKSDHNSLPAALSDLVDKGYMVEVPIDPYSDKPLIYKKTADDFILYSIGLNQIDDGGVIIEKRWYQQGDAVFWPTDTEVIEYPAG